ncbi:hypothetical protein VPH35_029295 [Triticum aestivum]
MALKKTPKGKSGFFSVRVKPSGNFGVEFFDVGRLWWLSTDLTANEAAKQEFYWKCDVEEKKKKKEGVEKEDEAGPSTVIPIKTLSEEDEEFWWLSDDFEESYWMPSDDE